LGETTSNGSYRHEAFVFRDADEFLVGTVPFLTAGLDAEEPLLVAVPPARERLLRDALGDAADDVRFLDMTQLGGNPARIIPVWRQFLEAHAASGRPVRGIGEPLWPGRRPEEVAEVQLHEALLNVAVEPDTPFWLLCPYDAGALGPAVVEEAYRSHPAIVDAGQYRGSTSYGGRAHVDTVLGNDLSDLGLDFEELAFRREDHPALVATVALRAYAAGIPADRAADLAAGVHELVKSSLRRGAGDGLVRIWTREDAVICEVHDTTIVRDPLLGRRLPGRDGVWAANQLCDLVSLRSTSAGTTVRVHTWR